MHPFIRILRALTAISSTAIGLSACAHRADSLKLLEARAGYQDGLDENDTGLFDGGVGAKKSTLTRRSLTQARVYLHPSRLPSGDQFWGGYLTLNLRDRDQESEIEGAEEFLEQDRAALIEVEPKKLRRRSKSTPVNQREPRERVAK